MVKALYIKWIVSDPLQELPRVGYRGRPGIHEPTLDFDSKRYKFFLTVVSHVVGIPEIVPEIVNLSLILCNSCFQPAAKL